MPVRDGEEFVTQGIQPNRYVQRAGDSMLGSLILAGDPTQPLEAATIQYVDNRIVEFDTFLELTDTPNVYNAGRILFETASAVSDNANLFWDDNNSRLSIGINPPIRKLHVADDSGNPQFRIEYSGAIMAEFEVDSSADLNIIVPGGNLKMDTSNFIMTGDLEVNDITASGEVKVTGDIQGDNFNIGGTLDFTGVPKITHSTILTFEQDADIASGDVYDFNPSAGSQLTASSGMQNFMTLQPDINQSGTATYRGLFMDITQTATGGTLNAPIFIQVDGTPIFALFSGGSFNAGNGTAVMSWVPGNSDLSLTDGSTTYIYTATRGIEVPVGEYAFVAATFVLGGLKFTTLGFEFVDIAGNTQFSIDAAGAGAGNVVIGAGLAGVDYSLTFNGETNDGVVTWMEDEDYFKFADDINIDTLTASKPVWTDANKTLISKDITACDVVRTRLTPSTQTVNTGTLTSGTVSDVQTWADGNEVHITEVTGVPGFDVEYRIDNVADFCFIGVSFYYVGSSVHECQVQIYDDTNTTWRELHSQAGAGLSHNYRFTDFPGTVSDYINGSNQVKIRFYHPQSGNASHDLYIDYVSIIGTST